MRLAIFLSLCAAATLPAFPSTDRSLRIPASFGKELLFEVNQGQAPTQVQFLARNPSYTLLLAPSTATLLFKKAANASPLAIHFERSNPAAIASGLAPSPAKINYFSGSEASTWRTNINTYRKVRYASLYPGIDLVFYGKGNFLEYDLLVEPGADPAKIALSFGSSILPSIAANGDLVLPLATGELRCHSPLLYQPGPHSTAISGKYVLHADRTVSFTLGPYDRTKTLVIDPVVTYSSYLGGSDDEGIFGIQRDREGNLYVAGETSSLNFPTADPVQPFEGGDYDAFVSKFDPTGTRLIYSTYLGGSGYDHAVGLAVDPRGDAYVAGLTTSSNFPTKLPLQAVLKGQQNAFVVHLNHSGSDLIFSTYLGGTRFDTPQDMTIDGSSAIYIAGFTNSPDYPVTPGAFQTACDGPDGLGAGFCNTDAFVTKLASDGSKLLYSTFLGGSLSDFGAGIAVDARGAAYITGQSNSPDFPLLNPYQSRLAGLANAFVTKLNPSGSKLEFSTYLGGSGQDGGNAIAVSPDGEVYATGYTSSTDFPLVGPFQTTNHGGFSDCFISKLSSDGHDLLKSTYFGGSGLDYPFRIALDVFGSVSVTGLTASSDLPTSHAVQDTFGGGTYDAFVLKLLPDSFRPLYSTYFGGVGDEFGYSIHSEPFGAVWFGGSTSSLNFPIRKAYQSTYAGGPFDAFLTQLSLTIPDYFRLLEDLLSGYPTLRQTAPWQDLSLMQNRFSDNNSQGAIADLQQLDLAMQNAAERNEFPSLHLQRALAVSRHLQETLRRR